MCVCVPVSQVRYEARMSPPFSNGVRGWSPLRTCMKRECICVSVYVFVCVCPRSGPRREWPLPSPQERREVGMSRPLRNGVRRECPLSPLPSRGRGCPAVPHRVPTVSGPVLHCCHGETRTGEALSGWARVGSRRCGPAESAWRSQRCSAISSRCAGSGS